MRRPTEKKELTLQQTKDKALRLLEFRSHSEFELVQKLKRAGAMDAHIQEVMEFLREYHLVDDATYAARMAVDLKHLKKYGRHRILAELHNRGIDRADAEAAVAELDEDEVEQLKPLLEKRLSGNFEQKNLDKCIRYFAYRGYGFDDIKRCIEELKEE